MIALAHPAVLWTAVVLTVISLVLVFVFVLDDITREAVLFTVVVVTAIAVAVFGVIAFVSWTVCGGLNC